MMYFSLIIKKIFNKCIYVNGVFSFIKYIMVNFSLFIIGIISNNYYQEQGFFILDITYHKSCRYNSKSYELFSLLSTKKFIKVYNNSKD